MKQLWLGVLLLASVACFSQAQNQTRPLLGSKQNVEKSGFCKKYKCKKMPEDIGLGYILELPNDELWDDIQYYPSSKGKNVAELWSIYRTTMDFSLDEKTKQIKHISFWLRQNFRGNKGTYVQETLMLADAIYYAMGKRLTLGTSLGEPYAPDISDCFLTSRAVQKENIERLTRVMMTAEVMLETEKRKAQARAVCSSRFNGSTPDRYMPAFWIEITPEKG